MADENVVLPETVTFWAPVAGLGVGVDGLLLLRLSVLEKSGPLELGAAVPVTIPWPPVELAVKIAPLMVVVHPSASGVSVGNIVPLEVTPAAPNPPSLSVSVDCSLSEEPVHAA